MKSGDGKGSPQVPVGLIGYDERRKMRLGLSDMPLHPPGRNLTETYDLNLELVKFVDKLGYDEAWIGEHFTIVWENMPAPDLFIARAIGETERIVLSTGVVLLAFHDPVMVAHRIAMLDHLAKGRFYFGIGSGGVPTDFQVFGLDKQTGSPRDRMKESIEVILKYWTEDGPFEHQGTFYHKISPEPIHPIELYYHMKPYQKPHPPIAVAGSSPDSETLVLAGEMGWWPMSSNFLHSTALPRNWQAVEKGASRTGATASRNDWRIARQIHVADTTEQAQDEALNGAMADSFENYFRPLMGFSRSYANLKRELEMSDDELTSQYMLDNFWIVGDPDECTRQLRQLYEDVGGFGTLLLVCHDWGKDQKKWYHSLELMAKEVLPALQDLPAVVA